MPSLTAERLAERDREVRASGRDRSQFSQMMRRGDEFAAERADLARDRFEAQQAQRSVSNTFKEAELNMKAEGAAQRATAAEAARDMADRRTAAIEAESRLRLAAAEAKETETLAAREEAATFLLESIALDPNQDDFEDRLTELQARTLRGSKHPEVEKRASYLMDKRKEAMLLRADRAKFEDAAQLGMRPRTVKAGDVTMEQPDAPEADSWEKWGKELATATAAFDTPAKVPAEVWASFEKRKAALAGGAAPAATQPAAATLPTLTSKAEFDALPAGAEYIRDGRRYRKP